MREREAGLGCVSPWRARARVRRARGAPGSPPACGARARAGARATGTGTLSRGFSDNDKQESRAFVTPRRAQVPRSGIATPGFLTRRHTIAPAPGTPSYMLSAVCPPLFPPPPDSVGPRMIPNAKGVVPLCAEHARPTPDLEVPRVAVVQGKHAAQPRENHETREDSAHTSNAAPVESQITRAGSRRDCASASDSHRSAATLRCTCRTAKGPSPTASRRSVSDRRARRWPPRGSKREWLQATAGRRTRPLCAACRWPRNAVG